MSSEFGNPASLGENGSDNKIIYVDREFPEHPLERAGAMLAAFNAPTKRAVIIELNQFPYFTSPTSVGHQFIALHQGSKLATFAVTNVGQYCGDTLGPIGMATEERKEISQGEEKITGHAVNEAGGRYGQPTAAAFYMFEVTHGFSLFPILGQTGKRGEASTRAPLNTALVLLSLRNHGKTQAEIANELGVSNSVVQAVLQRLSQNRIVAYESLHTASGKKQMYFELGHADLDKVQQIGTFVTLTQQVAQISIQIASEGLQVTQHEVFRRLPEEAKKNVNTDYLESRINRVLRGLSKQEFLKQGPFTGSKSGKAVFSSAKLTDKGILVVNEVLLPLFDAMRDGETLDYWRREVLPEVKRNFRFYARTAGDLFYPFSKAAKQEKYEYYVGAVYKHIVDAFLGEESTHEITDPVSRERELELRRLSRLGSTIAEELDIPQASIHNYVKALISQGLIRAVQMRGTTYYEPILKTDQQQKVVFP